MNSLTVAQLIEFLQKQPQDIPVVVLWDGGLCAIEPSRISVINEGDCEGWKDRDRDLLEIDVEVYGSYEP